MAVGLAQSLTGVKSFYRVDRFLRKHTENEKVRGLPSGLELGTVSKCHLQNF